MGCEIVERVVDRGEGECCHHSRRVSETDHKKTLLSPWSGLVGRDKQAM